MELSFERLLLRYLVDEVPEIIDAGTSGILVKFVRVLTEEGTYWVGRIYTDGRFHSVDGEWLDTNLADPNSLPLITAYVKKRIQGVPRGCC